MVPTIWPRKIQIHSNSSYSFSPAPDHLHLQSVSASAEFGYPAASSRNVNEQSSYIIIIIIFSLTYEKWHIAWYTACRWLIKYSGQVRLTHSRLRLRGWSFRFPSRISGGGGITGYTRPNVYQERNQESQGEAGANQQYESYFMLRYSKTGTEKQNLNSSEYKIKVS